MDNFLSISTSETYLSYCVRPIFFNVFCIHYIFMTQLWESRTKRSELPSSNGLPICNMVSYKLLACFLKSSCAAIPCSCCWKTFESSSINWNSNSVSSLTCSGPTNIHLRKATGFFDIPTAPPNPFTCLLFCSCPWFIGIQENLRLDLFFSSSLTALESDFMSQIWPGIQYE